MCWPSLRRLWMRILGINSPVAFFLTFTRYQYANVIPVLKFVVWYKFILHLTVMFTYSHTYWYAYTPKNKYKPNKRQNVGSSVQPVSLSSSPTVNFGQVSTELVPQLSRTQDNSRPTCDSIDCQNQNSDRHCELTLKIFVMVIQAITFSFFLSINW